MKILYVKEIILTFVVNITIYLKKFHSISDISELLYSNYNISNDDIKSMFLELDGDREFKSVIISCLRITMIQLK